MKTLRKPAVAVAMAVMMVVTNPITALAAHFVTKQHGVTVQIAEVLSISADVTNFTLTFTGYVKTGDESTSKTVTYTVQSNDMRQADGATAINMNLDALYDQMDFLADVGAYTKTSGNTGLAESAAGFVMIKTTNTAVAKKANTTAGTNGKLLNGTIPITYKAKATADVPAGGQVKQLFVTLTAS